MITSTISIFKVPFIEAQNYKIDDINTYLGQVGAVYTFSNIQAFKPMLYTTLKLNLEQTWSLSLDDVKLVNYISIINNIENSKYQYYYVIDQEWKSQNTVIFNLKLDVLNTFTDLSFSNKTYIERQHVDRYAIEKDIQAYPILNFKNEGINPELYNQGEERILKNYFLPDLKWYLVYMNADISTEDATAPINCFVCADKDINVYLLNPDIINYTTFMILEIGAIYAPAGTQYQYAGVEPQTVPENKILRISWNLLDVKKITVELLNYSAEHNYIDKTQVFKGENNIEILNYGNNKKGTSKEVLTDWDAINATYKYYIIGFQNRNIKGVDNLNRSLSTLVKVIELPYQPFNVYLNSGGLYQITENWYVYDADMQMIRLLYLFKGFTSEIEMTYNPLDFYMHWTRAKQNPKEERRKTHEPKLNHSEFRLNKFIYDSFSYVFRLENYTVNDKTSAESFYVKFKPSNNIASKFLFDFTSEQYYTLSAAEEDYPKSLIVQRNNEISLFNNSYLNYIRNGYNFDVKNKQRQEIFNWLNFGIGGAATIGGAFAGNPISLATGASTGKSLLSNIQYSMQAETNIQQKITLSKAQATSVFSADDLSLLNEYANNNKMKYIEYTPRPQVLDQIWLMFHFTGYKCEYQDIPKINGRIWFNYVQCKAVFANPQTVPVEYLNLIIEKYNNGVTIFHKYNDEYNLEQTHENWEVFMCE